MGTIVETETFPEATDVLNLCYKVLDGNCNQDYASAKFDVRKGKSNCMKKKVKSIEAKIGKVNL